MGWFNDDHECTQAYNEYQATEHKGKISHELLGGAVAYEAAKAYENHCAENGRPDNHARAKEIVAGFAGAFVDREFETHGLDFIDKEKAKRHAEQQCTAAVDQYEGY